MKRRREFSLRVVLPFVIVHDHVEERELRIPTVAAKPFGIERFCGRHLG